MTIGMSGQRVRSGLFLCILLSLAGCGTKNQSVQDATILITPHYIELAEAQLVLVASELGAPASVPARGVMAELGCYKITCETDTTGASATTHRNLENCRARTFATGGSVSTKLQSVEAHVACATAQGPALFQKWPSRSAQIQITSSPYEIIHSNGKHIQISGDASLEFSNSTLGSVRFNHTAHVVASPMLAENGDFLFATNGKLKMDLPRFVDVAPRIFSGSFLMQDKGRKKDFIIDVDGVTYRKDICNHPIAGRMTLGQFSIDFTPKCGEVIITDTLGRTYPQKLPVD